MNNSLTNTAVIAMAGKPVHAGHFALIEMAARDNDDVVVFVSTADRIKKDEFPVYGQDMQWIWQNQLMPLLPKNVSIVHCLASPVSEAYRFIDNTSPDTHRVRIYGDPNDVTGNFPDASLKKYASKMYAANMIEHVPVPRTRTVMVSGTQMRMYLKQGNKFDFIAALPRGVDGEIVWNKLRSSTR